MLGANAVLVLMLAFAGFVVFFVGPRLLRRAVELWFEIRMRQEKLEQERLRREILEQELVNRTLEDEFRGRGDG